MNSIVSNRFCRALVLLAALLECSANAQSPSNAAPKAIPRRASIILIVADGLGYGDLSCYGQTKYQTPNLDRLAAEGIRFTNYSTYRTSSWSHASLLTGNNLASPPYPDFERMITARHTTITEILKNAGYHTGLIGEWDLGDENSAGAPWKKGFDEFAGYFSSWTDSKDVDNFYADYMFRYAPKAIFNETNNQMEDYIGREMIYTNTAGQKGQYIPDFYTHATLSFIKNNQPDAANHYQPFFLLLNYPFPKTGMTVPTDAPFSGEAWPQAEKNQAALISRLDGYVGELTEQLQKLGMTNNAVIFFTSSTIAQKANGVDPEFFHSNISTNDLRVPMIVHWPGRIPAEQVSGFKWSPQDFLPTAAAIAFANSPTNVDGISVLPFLSRKFEGKTSDLPDQREF
jgi:arylsulfatase A-like enzyme